MKLTWEQSQKYDWVQIEGGDRFFFRPDRTILQFEQASHVARQVQDNYWQKICRPIMKEIREKGGKAHCHVTHDFGGKIPPWWEYHVDEAGLNHTWVDKPKNPVNLQLGQSYYDNSIWHNTLASRYYRVNYVFWRRLDRWLWKSENKPKQAGNILKLTINDRLYFFAGGYNEHGVLCWQKLTDPSSVVQEVTMKE